MEITEEQVLRLYSASNLETRNMLEKMFPVFFSVKAMIMKQPYNETVAVYEKDSVGWMIQVQKNGNMYLNTKTYKWEIKGDRLIAHK